MSKRIAEIREAIQRDSTRSAWERAVNAYALELIEDMPDDTEFYGSPADMKALLNGADTWTEYSEGGCSFIYDADIAERTCNPSELRRAQGGKRQPNSRESWLDVQARALHQAAIIIQRIARTPAAEEVLA